MKITYYPLTPLPLQPAVSGKPFFRHMVQSSVTFWLRHGEQKADMEWKNHSASTELRVKYYKRFREKRQQASITAQPSPSPPPQSCGTAVADLQETGYRSWGALKWTVWSTSCAGQSAVAQPWERWTGTAQGRQVPGSDCFELTKM